MKMQKKIQNGCCVQAPHPIKSKISPGSFLIKGFYRQGLQGTLIGNSLLGLSYCLSVN